MKSAKYLGLTALCVYLQLGFAAANAQSATAVKIPPAFEDLAAAAQIAQSNLALSVAIEPGATLAQKRAAVADPAVIQAIELLRNWLDTSQAPSRPDPDWVGIYSILLAVRSLGSMLVVRNYVFLADGHVADAIESVRDGLQLTYRIGSYSIAAWLSGVIIEKMLVDSLTPHLDQLSALDCDRLLRLVREWTNSNDALPIALETARVAKINKLQASMKPGAIDAVIQEMEESIDGTSIAMQMRSMGPQAINQAAEIAVAEINAEYNNVQLNLSTPYWLQPVTPQQCQIPAKLVDPVAQWIVRASMPADFSRTFIWNTRMRAAARLLGSHAAIRRYRWEHDSLPASLEVLKLGELSVNPFTGKQLTYKPNGSFYTLTADEPAGRSLPE